MIWWSFNSLHAGIAELIIKNVYVLLTPWLGLTVWDNGKESTKPSKHLVYFINYFILMSEPKQFELCLAQHVANMLTTLTLANLLCSQLRQGELFLT